MWVKIKFSSDEDRINGLYELATRTVVRCLPDDLFQVLEDQVALLDKAGISYKRLDANAEEERLAEVRNTAPSKIQ